MAQYGPGSELRAIAEWRNAMLKRVLLLCFAVLSGTLLLSLFRPFVFEQEIFGLVLLPAWLLVFGAAFWPRASLRFREITLVLGVLTAAVGSVAKLGFQAVNGFCAHLTLVVMVALFMGRRAAWGVWAIVLVSWGVIAVFSVYDATPVGNTLFDPELAANWCRVLVIYAILSATTLFVVSYLAERMESALRRSETLYEALTQESTQRIAALEEQRVLEEQLRQSQKLEALGTLAGGVAHDFNNLLMVIINHAELASHLSASERVRDSLQQIQTAGERAASLSRQLLAFGRRQVAERVVLNVNDRVEASLRMLQRLLPASIEVEHQLEAGKSRVWAGEVELDQIIMNLCVNARDAMPQGGKLTIRSSNERRRAPGKIEAQDFVCIEIQDAGIGMDEATRSRMFEPFFTTKSPGHGTGLGLSTVHGLVQQSGGFIEVDSALGRGTSVRIFLPCHIGLAAEQASAAPLRSRRGYETLLVADDDPAVRTVLTQCLEENGYRVIACQDGEEALQEFRKRPKDIALVVSDAVMPKRGGRELHRAISSEFGEIPFLICSGYAAQTIESEFFDHPLRGFLGKPFDAQILQSRVRGLLDAAQSARAKAQGGQGMADGAAPAVERLAH